MSILRTAGGGIGEIFITSSIIRDGPAGLLRQRCAIRRVAVFVHRFYTHYSLVYQDTK